MTKKVISLFLIISIFSTSCMKTVTKYRTVPNYEEKRVPYDDYEYKTVVKEEYVTKPKYILGKSYFPLAKKSIKIAILPFSSSFSKQGAGNEVSSEIEYRMLEKQSIFKYSNKNTLKNEFYKMSKNYHGIENLFEEWYAKNRVTRYQILSRDQLEALMFEKRIQNVNLTSNMIMRHSGILGIDCIISGHVKRISSNEVSFIMKAISASSSKVFFTKRYEGDYDESFNNAVNDFYCNVMQSGTRKVKVKTSERQKVKVTKYKTKRVKTGTRKESYKVKEPDWASNIGIIATFILFLANAGKSKE